MKFISIVDQQGNTHLINPDHIVRIEKYQNSIIIWMSDKFGIHTPMTVEQLMSAG